MSDTQAEGYHVVEATGGVDTLTLLMGILAPDCSAPSVMAQHLDPQYPNHRAGSLSHHCPLSLRTVTSRVALTHGEVFVGLFNQQGEIAQHQVCVRAVGPDCSTPSIRPSASDLRAEVVGWRGTADCIPAE